MSSPARLRRLAADYEKIKDEFSGNKHIKVEVLEGNPPEKYRIIYKDIKGIESISGTKIKYRSNHIAEIYLHSEYPREKPKCTLNTPIYHPNFGPFICVGDHWAAGETLADLIVKIGNMIQYQDYNVKSPLNAEAARWAREHESMLPIDHQDLFQAEAEIVLGGSYEDNLDDVDIVLK
jgi:ubiquitin-protein ligase